MGFLDSILALFFRKKSGKLDEPKEIYMEQIGEGVVESIDEIHSVWDYLRFQEHTQAFHITNVVGFDEWVAMDEIRRRVTDLFNVSYKNERSLYPYIKTLVDIGLMETSNVGGKRKWRKKDLMIKIKVSKKAELPFADNETKTRKKRE